MLAYALLRLAESTGDRAAATAAAQEALEIARTLAAQPLQDEVLEVSRRARLSVGGEPAVRTAIRSARMG